MRGPSPAGHGPSRLLVVALCAALAAGCASIPKTPARLYNLDNGELIQVKLFYFQRGYGAATAILPGGTTMEGTYSLAVDGASASGPGAGDKQSRGKRADYARVFGYAEGSRPQPVGYGTLSGPSGLALRFLLYSVDPARRYGAGLGRDNRGNWYRVHVGDLDQN